MSQEQRTWLHRALRASVTIVIVAAVGAGAIWGFIEGQREREIEEEREAPVNVPLRVAMVAGQPTITLDDAARESTGLETVQLQSTEHQAQVQAYGTVLDLQALTELSNSYTTTKAQLLTAEAKRNASRMAFERAQRLYNDQQNISAAQLQAAEAAFRVDEATVSAAEAQSQNLAASAVQQWGTVIGRELVDRSQRFLRLLQREDVLVQVTLPPGQGGIAPPNTAIAQPVAGRQTTIRFVSPAPRTDVRIQGVSFFYTAPASSGLLPGMNVLVLIATGNAASGALVPGSAVVWTEGKAWAYFRTAAQTFVRREIATDAPASDGGYVVMGLADNSEIVTQGAQMLLSEEFRSQIQVGEE